MRWLLALPLVVALAGQALSESCYTRTYSAEHLRQNPDQTVRQLAIRFTESNGEHYASVRVLFRDTDRVYTEGLVCWQPKAGEHGNAFIGCAIECDGGYFTARHRGSDAILVETGFGFVVSGGCGDDDEDLRWVKDRGASKTVFKLYETALATCPAE